MGWSHGGFITAHLVMREETPFKAGAAIVRESGIGNSGNWERGTEAPRGVTVPGSGSQARAKRATDSLFPIPYVPGSAT